MPQNNLHWQDIETVLLDMDGTLLDLNFDNHFWQVHVPLRYAELHNISISQSQELLFPKFRSAEGTLDWYCVDYWSSQLGMDIQKLKKEVDHLIAVHPFVIEFLDRVRNSGRRLLLVTNAHVKSLEIKLEQTQLTGFFHHIVVSHDIGCPKETLLFWEKLHSIESYQAQSTLLVDDSLPVLKAAKEYGLSYLRAVRKPDTQREAKDSGEFTAIDSFQDIMPE